MHFMPRRVTIDINLRIFQYKILNDVLYLNEKLFKFKIVSSLNSEDGTPIHLFYSCNQTKSLWFKFQELLNSEILLHKIRHRVLILVSQMIKKILKPLAISIFILSIICLNPGIQEK